MRDSQITLADGRLLTYADFGASSGTPALYFHGAPTSRFDLVPFEEQLAALDVRVIAPDRPGYGGSTPKHGRVRADWTADATQIIDTLGLDRVVVVGYSAGGPYAIEFAASCPDRVTGVGVLAGTTDMGWSGAWKGYPTEHEADVLRLDDPDAVLTRCMELFGEDGSGFMAGVPALAPSDEAVFADEAMATNMLGTMSEGLRQGIIGYAEDAYAESHPWNLNAATITAPVILLHGGADSIVPIAHSEHTAEIVPTAELTTRPDDGHVSIVLEAPTLLRNLAATK